MPITRCPTCSGFLSLYLVVPHPVNTGEDIHSFECAACGRIVSQVVAIVRVEQVRAAA
jgi:hypothetical protein